MPSGLREKVCHWYPVQQRLTPVKLSFPICLTVNIVHLLYELLRALVGELEACSIIQNYMQKSILYISMTIYFSSREF